MPPRRSTPSSARPRAQHRPRIAWPVLTVFGLLIAALVAGGVALDRFVRTSPYFIVRQVRVPKGVQVPLARALLGRNLWSVELSSVQQTTAQANPTFKGVRVWRQWPQRIVVEATRRTPVAQVRASRYYPVDAEGFVMTEGAPAPLPGLIVLDGVDNPVARLAPGRLNRSPRLAMALAALVRLRSSSELRGHVLQRVDCSHPSQVVVYLDDGLEVRMGPPDDWPRRLPQLRKSLEMLAQKQLSPAYVDLRFGEDPIIGPPR